MDRPVFTGTFRGGICVTTGSAMRLVDMPNADARHAPPHNYGAPTRTAAQIRCTDTHRRTNTRTDTHRRTNTPLKQADGLCLPNPSSMC